MKIARLPSADRESAPVEQIPLQPASFDIWDKKYRLKAKDGQTLDDSVDSTWRRVARALAAVETTPELRERWYEKFLWALRHGAIPAGRIVSNAGAWEHKPATSTINCTVSGVIQDSMNDILAKAHEGGLTLKAGCGIGYCFSTLRPRGAYVCGAGAFTSGPLSFMDIYDKMCFTVSSAGGRRGAQMATFDIGHPDVIDFIRAKREHGRLRQFNLSLLITREFIEAVKNDADWPLAFPIQAKEAATDGVDLNDPKQILWREWPTNQELIINEKGQAACKIYKTIRARRLWDLVMSSTYDYAEPGFILIDKVNEMNNNWWCEYIQATNPCVTGDAWVHTSQGPRQVVDLIGKSFSARVDGEDYYSGPCGFFKTGVKPVICLQTYEGYTLRLTTDHPVRCVTRLTPYSIETGWRAAGELCAGDRILLNDHRQNPSWQGNYGFAEGYLIGLLMGDGTIKQDGAVLSAWSGGMAVNSNLQTEENGVYAVMAEAKRYAEQLPHRSDFKGWRAIAGCTEHRLSLAAITDLAAKLGLRPGAKTMTPELEQTSSEFHRSFLRGLFDADGSVQGSQSKGVSIRLAQSDGGCLQAVQRMLLRLGIASTIYRNRHPAGKSRHPNGKAGYANYPVKPQHELVISGANLLVFKELIDFNHADKQRKLAKMLASHKRALNRERLIAVIKKLTPDGVEDVYDVQIPGVNAFDANGLYVHNCGEQPLPPYGSCLLGSVDLTKFARHPFTEQAAFDWDKFREVVAVFTRLLDNVVEIHGLPLEPQRQEIMNKRRHGMGYLGLGSTLTMLRLRYGEPDSLAFTEAVTREMALTGWKVALELAREKGPAPIMEQEFTVTSKMLAQHPEMAADGYSVGDAIKGKTLHARYSRYMQRVAAIEPELARELAEIGARFTHHTSIAPTGTISLSLANNASNGVEPSFAHHYFRNVIREGRKTKEKIDVFSFELLAYRHLVNPKAMPLSDDPQEKLPDYFITADDVTPRQHVDIQAAAQQWIDSSISKTANVPTDFPFEDFKDIYMYAYEKGLKGCTTFRFNPEVFQGVLVKEQDLENTVYRFTLEDGTVVEAKGNEEIEYDGEIHTAANLFDALKEGFYGKF